ncbi:actin-histidine N-methyltransferase isoform X2 [Plodia interpunctella]|uniref:actin-histidine N-methyltransferase isoform X2 n=1 Tax=Plodia interpunctella TaxID=58824 RepID=UPI002368C044|nr:actin-histidine N-methyltransferase isoform X2 [Plodia interpunctella]
MGRKSHSKHPNKKNPAKDNRNNIIRKELAILVDKLLKLTSVFQAATHTSKSWDHHLEINAILKEIVNIETPFNSKAKSGPRQKNIDVYLKWLKENGAQFEGVEIGEYEDYELGLKAVNNFKEGSLLLTVPTNVMMTEQNARESNLAAFINVDPLLQNMPNITLALFLLLEKNKDDSVWKPYIDVLPDKYSTILYFTTDELLELKPSPVFESALKLYRSIARQYAYFYNKMHTLDLPVLENLKDIFTFESYRWAVSTVMTRQNNIQLGKSEITAFIPLWDMCNHEHGKITTDFNNELNRGECYALRDFKAGEQIFIFYGARPNADLFLHNGFVYPNNQHDSLSLPLGVSSSDPLRETKVSLLTMLGLSAVTHYSIYRGDCPISPELLAFIRIFNMNQDKSSSAAVGADIDRRAYTYLLTRCKLIKASYKKMEKEPVTLHRNNIKLLKECEVQILDRAIKYLEGTLPTLTVCDRPT